MSDSALSGRASIPPEVIQTLAVRLRPAHIMRPKLLCSSMLLTGIAYLRVWQHAGLDDVCANVRQDGIHLLPQARRRHHVDARHADCVLRSRLSSSACRVYMVPSTFRLCCRL